MRMPSAHVPLRFIRRKLTERCGSRCGPSCVRLGGQAPTPVVVTFCLGRFHPSDPMAREEVLELMLLSDGEALELHGNARCPVAHLSGGVACEPCLVTVAAFSRSRAIASSRARRHRAPGVVM